MNMEFRDEKYREIEEKRISHFCERYGSTLCKKNPKEIIQMWCNFEFARFQVIESNDGFYINDMDDKTMVAFVSKKDSSAFSHAFSLCEELNNPRYPSVSVDGRELAIMGSNSLIQLNDNAIVDFLINSIENDENEL